MDGNEDGFAEFGGPHILSMLTEVATRALKAVWARSGVSTGALRREEFVAALDNHLTGRSAHELDAEILRWSAPLVRQQHGTQRKGWAEGWRGGGTVDTA